LTKFPGSRSIPEFPFKVLDAPSLPDDFYLDLLDWSTTNLLAVGLEARVYIWHAVTADVTKLCDLAELIPSDKVASVKWHEKVRIAASQGIGLID